jgi:hypothetical protein
MAPLVLTSALNIGELSTSRVRPLYTRERKVCKHEKYLAYAEIRTPNLPARSLVV